MTNEIESGQVAPYLAGLFEGEGSVGGYVQRPRRPGDRKCVTVRCAIEMNDLDVIERLAALTGVGRTFGPYEHGHKGYTQRYAWIVSSARDVHRIYEMIRPFLGKRRIDQFEAALLAHRARDRRCAECASAFRPCFRCYQEWLVAIGEPLLEPDRVWVRLPGLALARLEANGGLADPLRQRIMQSPRTPYGRGERTTVTLSRDEATALLEFLEADAAALRSGPPESTRPGRILAGTVDRIKEDIARQGATWFAKRPSKARIV